MRVATAAWLFTCGIVHAQVQWVTTPNTPVTDIALFSQSAVSGPNDSVYTSAYTTNNPNSQQSYRTRIAKLSSTGTEEWSRWVEGQPLTRSKSLFVHVDGSVSQVTLRPNQRMCVVNYGSDGTNRANYCVASTSSEDIAIQFGDDDLLLARGVYRTITKLSRLGVQRWTRSETQTYFGSIWAAGLDSAGDYFEIAGGRLRIYRATDGSERTSVQLAQFSQHHWTATADGAHVAPLSNGDFVLIHTRSIASGAVIVSVARYGGDGTRKWTRDVSFTGFFNEDEFSLFNGASDDVILARTGRTIGAGSEIAKLSSNGDVLWQRPLSRVWKILKTVDALLGIRIDGGGGGGSSSSLIPISPIDGSQNTATATYSRNDNYVPNRWLSLSGGVLAGFENYIGNANYPYPAKLASNRIFVSPSLQWSVAARAAPDRQASQYGCFMPKLAQSSPAKWWAQSRMPASSPQAPTEWFGTSGVTGSIESATPEATNSCGFPMTDSGDQMVTRLEPGSRVKRLDANGGTIWQAASNLYPNQYDERALLQVNASGETTYVIGSLIGRATAGGVIAFETNLSGANPRYLNVGTDGISRVVYINNNGEPALAGISGGGGILWSTTLNVPGCNETLTAASTTTANETLVALQACGEARVFKVGSGGTISWQRIVSGAQQLPYVQVRALSEDSAGNLYAAGCAGKQEDVEQSPYSVSLVTSWSATGGERWTLKSDAIGGQAECATSITIDASYRVYASVSAVETQNPVLWSIEPNGTERWRHAGLLSEPAAAQTELMMSGGELAALGESSVTEFGGRVVSLRKIDPNGIGTSQQLKFLDVPAGEIGYRELFAVRIGVRTAADAPTVVSNPTRVRIGLENGSGLLDGVLECVIETGASDCIVSGLLYDAIESGVLLAASADGYRTVVSSPISFTRAATTTVIEALNSPPYVAYSIIRVRTRVDSAAIPEPNGYAGYLNGPYSPGGMFGCTSLTLPGSILANECSVIVTTLASPLVAGYSDSNQHFLASTATPFTIPVTKATPAISAEPDPSNTFVAGDRIRLRVQLTAPSGFNVAPLVSATSVSVNGIACWNVTRNGTIENGYIGSYYLCDLPSAIEGALDVVASFAGNDDLHAASSQTVKLTITQGGVVRSLGYLPDGVSICSTAPGVDCTRAAAGQSGWQCVGPAGMTGAIFFVPASNDELVFRPAPLAFNNLSGALFVNAPYERRGTYSACRLDPDKDGAQLAMTDGILILRKMLGLSGEALVQGATHSCVPIAPIAVSDRIVVANYDIDGSGQVDPATDGLLIVRALLGFTGQSLVEGAVASGAQRKTADEILDYLRWDCTMLQP